MKDKEIVEEYKKKFPMFAPYLREHTEWLKEALNKNSQAVREVERLRAMKDLWAIMNGVCRYKCGKHKKLISLIEKKHANILTTLNKKDE